MRDPEGGASLDAEATDSSGINLTEVALLVRGMGLKAGPQSPGEGWLWCTRQAGVQEEEARFIHGSGAHKNKSRNSPGVDMEVLGAHWDMSGHQPWLVSTL